MPEHVRLASQGRRVDWRRVGLILLGVALFLIVLLSPPWPNAVDPMGEEFELTREGKAALALFLITSLP